MVDRTGSREDIVEGPAAGRASWIAPAARWLLLFAALAVSTVGVPPGFAEDEEALPPARGTIKIDEAVRRALVSNQDLLTRGENVESSAGRKKQALQGYLPGISARGGWSHGFDADEQGFRLDPNTGNLVPPEEDLYSYNLTLNQNLIDWAQIKRIQSASRGLDATKFDFSQARADLVLATKQQFYVLLASQFLSDVADSALVVSQQELRRVNSLFELGMVARGDVLKAQVRLSQSQLDVIRARNTVVLERSRLAAIMGQDPTDDLIADDSDVSRGPVEVDSVAVTNESLANRSDLKAAYQSWQAAEASVGAAKAGYLPTVSGTLQYNRSQDDDLAFTGTRSRFGGIAVNFPILQSPLGTRGDIQTNRAVAEQARYQHDKKKIEIEVEVRQSIANAQNANEGLGVAREQVGSAEEDLKLSQEKYNVGSGTILELIDAQVALQRSRTNLVQAVTTARIAEAQLERVRGRTP